MDHLKLILNDNIFLQCGWMVHNYEPDDYDLFLIDMDFYEVIKLISNLFVIEKIKTNNKTIKIKTKNIDKEIDIICKSFNSISHLFFEMDIPCTKHLYNGEIIISAKDSFNKNYMVDTRLLFIEKRIKILKARMMKYDSRGFKCVNFDYSDGKIEDGKNTSVYYYVKISDLKNLNKDIINSIWQ